VASDKPTWTVAIGVTNPIERKSYRSFTSAKGRIINELDKLIEWATKFDKEKREELLVIRKEVDDYGDTTKGATWEWTILGAPGRIQLIANK